MNQPNTQIQRSAPNAMAKASDQKTLGDVIGQHADDIKRLAGSVMTIERLTSLAFLAVRKTPALANCTVTSIVAACLDAARLGLEPDGVQGAIIPYKGSAAFQPMYRGLIALCHRDGTIDTIEAFAAREGDTFEVVMGTSPGIVHRPNMRGTGVEKVIAYYAIAHLNGRMQFEVMLPWEIERIKARSPSASSGRSTPWDTDYDEMAKKTVLKRLMKKLPSSATVRDAVNHDNEVETERMTIEVDANAKPKGNDRLAAAASKQLSAERPVDVEEDATPFDDDVQDAPPPPKPTTLADALKQMPTTSTAAMTSFCATLEGGPVDVVALRMAVKTLVLSKRDDTTNPIDRLAEGERAPATKALKEGATADVGWCKHLVGLWLA